MTYYNTVHPLSHHVWHPEQIKVPFKQTRLYCGLNNRFREASVTYYRLGGMYRELPVCIMNCFKSKPLLFPSIWSLCSIDRLQALVVVVVDFRACTSGDALQWCVSHYPPPQPIKNLEGFTPPVFLLYPIPPHCLYCATVPVVVVLDEPVVVYAAVMLAALVVLKPLAGPLTITLIISLSR